MIEGQQTPTLSTAPRSARMWLAGTRLGRSPYLSSDERQVLESAAAAPRSVRTSMDLAREGERSELFHLLIEGWACRFKTTSGGGRQIAALLLPGDAANLDSALLDPLDYGVRTLTEVKVVSIPRDRLAELARRHAGIAVTLAWMAMGENAILTQWALCLGRRSARMRLAHLLCEVSTRLGAIGNGEAFELPLTQEQIADALGITPVHVNRTIQQLRGEGLIESRGRTVSIADVGALRRVGEFSPAYLHDGTTANLLSGAPA